MKFPNLDVEKVPEIEGFFDLANKTISYVVKDPASKGCAIIDSVLDMDYAAGRITYESAGEIPCDESGAPMLKVPLNGL